MDLVQAFAWKKMQWDFFLDLAHKKWTKSGFGLYFFDTFI